jgi:hypothetical protein
MAASTYMLSLLARQHLVLGAGFFERYSSAWLVWEPGPWRPARSILTSNTETTLLPANMGAPRPEGEDALCFELKPQRAAAVTVGRGTENEIVINDLTVSREQFVLEFSGNGWAVRSRGTPLTVEGKAVEAEGAVLQNGFVLSAGDVRMTFYSADGFSTRLAAESQKHR